MTWFEYSKINYKIYSRIVFFIVCLCSSLVFFVVYCWDEAENGSLGVVPIIFIIGAAALIILTLISLSISYYKYKLLIQAGTISEGMIKKSDHCARDRLVLEIENDHGIIFTLDIHIFKKNRRNLIKYSVGNKVKIMALEKRKICYLAEN